MQSIFKDVQDFHHKMGVTEEKLGNLPHLLNDEDMSFRINFLVEELEETILAYEAGNIEDVFDGLIDLIYVALGTADMMGLPFDAGWERVQLANMAKELAKSVEESASSTGRGHKLDVIKPEGWIAPDLSDLCIASTE